MSTTQRYAAVVGTFDGIHPGHRYLLDQLKAEAATRGLATRVFTFTDHPLMTLCPERAPRLLTTVAEKATLLDACGLDRYDINDFASVSHMTARQYMEHVAAMGVEVMMLGYDNRFGSDRLQAFDDFVKEASGTGVQLVRAIELLTDDGIPLNSSMIREVIAQGDVESGARLLGYEYRVTGQVVQGKQLGRKLGFPTANIAVGSKRKLLPGNGVYACRAQIGDKMYSAMVNVGHRPTVDGPDSPVNIEAHLVDFDGDAYGATVTLYFVKRLRSEKRFASLADLQAQLQCDLMALKSLNL